MFQAACNIARYFTRPIIISWQTVDGKCHAGIGTHIVVNKDGWFLTAAHIMEVMRQLMGGTARTEIARRKIAAVNSDKSLDQRERRRRIAAIGEPKPDDTEKWAVWWGQDGVYLEGDAAQAIEAVDFALGRLVNVHTTEIKHFPVFQDSKGVEPPVGASLCRMGFPFWDLKPVWDKPSKKFQLTQNVPLPLFVNEGILSRTFLTILTTPDGKPHDVPFPLRCIETSSPGLMGQSGGPIFDPKGHVWAIQTARRSEAFDLGTKEPQYYDIGIGVHSETIIGMLKDRGVEHQVSDD